MNKARRKSNKQSAVKKLVRESFVLSSTRALSSRVVRFFQIGLASCCLTSVRKIDGLAKKYVTAPIVKKTELRKNLSMPVRNTVASFCANNKFMKSLSSLRASVLNASIRTVGVFFLTFGVYAAAMILLRRFVNLPLGSASADDLIFAGLTVIAGLLLAAFGEKSNIETIGSGKIPGSLLSGVLGVNESSLNKFPTQVKTYVGTGFLLGSASGVLTVFWQPIAVMLAIITLAVISAIICIPEFGLLLVVATIAVLPVKWVMVMAAATLVSYVIKCLRLKRNFRCGTADFIMLVAFLILPVFCISFRESDATGGGYLLFGIALYFVAKNLICTKRLLLQTFNALCLGSFLGMVAYLIGEAAASVPHPELRAAAAFLSQNAVEADMLAVLVSICLPFALSSFSAHGTRQRNVIYPILAAVCAFVSGSLTFYVMLAISFFVFVAIAYKAPAGSLLGAAISLPVVVAYGSAISHSQVVSVFAENSFDKAFNLPLDTMAKSFFGAFHGLNGVIPTFLCMVAIVFCLQRIFAAALLKRSDSTTRLGGTVAAGAVMLVGCMAMFNLLADLRIVAMAWFILGLCGAAYSVLYDNDREEM